MTTWRKIGLAIAPLVFGALTQLGCGDDSMPAAPVAPLARKAAAPAAAAPVENAKTYQYAYNPLGKRDPFRAYTPDLQGPSVEMTLCNEPLCQWDLDQLSLVAVVSGDANPLAMLEDPAKIGHMVRRNGRVGRQGGKVTQILRDCIVITEYWTGPDGKINPNPVKVCIKGEQAMSPMLDLLNPQKRY
ncbi:MAG: pilus assembly protein PilP [Myxococcota bacterium]